MNYNKAIQYCNQRLKQLYTERGYKPLQIVVNPKLKQGKK